MRHFPRFRNLSAANWKSRPSVFAKGVGAAAGITASEIGWITAADYDQLSLASMRGSIFTRQLSRGWISGAADCDESVSAVTDYSAEITAAAEQGTVFGCQFHPEKSGKTGLAILKAFCEVSV